MASRFTLVSGASLAIVATQIAVAQEPAGALEEVIVTAQKRAENIQDVPIPITAIDSKTLENTAASLNTINLQQFVPGLVMGRSGTAAATFLRGVGTEAGTAGVESPVATYLDDIYLGVNALGVFELNNIEQVSVLKGPQGTLFGRNPPRGAIQITTKDPALDESDLDIEVGYGNYDTSTVRFYGSVPFSSTFGANLAVLYKNRGEGTVENIFTGNDLQAEEVKSAQTKLLWEPSDRTQMALNVIYSKGEDLPGLNYFVQETALSQDGQTRYVSAHKVNLFTDATMDVETTIGALTFSHDLGWGRVKNILSATSYTNDAFNDQAMTTGLPNPANRPASNAILDADIDEWTEELQLQSLGDAKLQWIVGLFVFDDQTDTHLQAFNYPAGVAVPGFGLDSTMKTRSYAGYAQGSGEIFKDTNLTLGARFTRDEKEFSGRNVFGGTVSPTLPPEKTFDKFTWRFALDHRFTDDFMTYLSYNRGFRSGTYSALALTNPPAKPETLDAYELGFKSDLLDRKVRLNASAFYYDYTDLQIRVNVGQPITALIINAAEAEIYGLDVDFEAQATTNLRIVGGIEVLHAEYTSFPNGPGNYPIAVPQLGMDPITVAPVGCTGTPRTGVGGHSNNLQCDLTGNDVINAPDFSASLGFEYSVPTGVGEFTFSLGDKYTGESFASPDNHQILDSYHFLTASLIWTSPSARYYTKVWGTNLDDSGRPAQMAFSLNTFEFLPNEPLLYGITFGARF
jgi:iron complex outermembrane receptor protein